MIRRAIACVSLLAAFGVSVSLPACGTQELPQDMCSWLKDENNCWQRFARDVACGDSTEDVCDGVVACGGTHVDAASSLAPTGFFAVRDALDICARSEGGQVVFDPPLDVSQFPLTSVAFKLLDAAGAPCGEGSIAGPQTFSLKIDNAPEGNPTILGGAFAITQADGTVATYDIACPGAVEQYHFNGFYLDKCLDKGVLAPAELLGVPSAQLESSPGAPEFKKLGKTIPAVDGYVRLRVSFPTGDVEYFNCSIPAPPPPCANGVKNVGEADIDCGGTCSELKLLCPNGSKCSVPTDCASSSCVADMTGIKLCTPTAP
ncbi:MAG: hypothetical protein EXR75_11320 [Myxococcales bacterium]|nr:hypothetical protein [Myxococcales bacterium]